MMSGSDDTLVFTSTYRVVDGELSKSCLGAGDPAIVSAWEDLATIAPREQLSDLALFGGFEPAGDEAAETLAFVNPLDDGVQFQMSVNTVEASADSTTGSSGQTQPPTLRRTSQRHSARSSSESSRTPTGRPGVSSGSAPSPAWLSSVTERMLRR